MEKVALITVTYNSAEVLRPFLKDVWRQSYKNIILYVIDNGSKDATLQILEQEKDSRLSIIKNKINFGVAKANNQGVKRAIEDECKQVLFINNDVEFESELVAKLLKVQFEKNCSLVVPKMMYYDSPNYIWYAGGWFLKYKGFVPLHRGMKERDVGQYNIIDEVEYAPTCCLLVKIEVFKQIGFMDEKFFVYFDDADFSYRILRTSTYKIIYAPNIKFYHKVGSLTKSTYREKGKIIRGNFFIKQNVRNHIYFLKKIGGVYAYCFIAFLFFKNNLKFFLNNQIKKDSYTWWLINKSYFQGLFLK